MQLVSITVRGAIILSFACNATRTSSTTPEYMLRKMTAGVHGGKGHALLTVFHFAVK